MKTGENATGHQTESASKNAQAKMVTGSAWMTAGSVTSRLIGALYVIPWVTWLGTYSTQANALFAKGYNIYSIFYKWQQLEFLLQFLKWLLIIMGWMNMELVATFTIQECMCPWRWGLFVQLLCLGRLAF